jgi:GNAT superfamily N-acetyltransferase
MIDRLTDITDIVDIIPAQPAHWPWICATFREQVALLPLTTRSASRAQADAIARVLRGRVCRAFAAVPQGFDDDLLGWSLGIDGDLIFAYVRDRLRRGGIGSQLMTAVTDRAPIPVAYWTPEAEAMEAHGFPIHYDIHAFRALYAYVRCDRRQHQHQHHQSERAA